jgi:hypothetical protein
MFFINHALKFSYQPCQIKVKDISLKCYDNEESEQCNGKEERFFEITCRFHQTTEEHHNNMCCRDNTHFDCHFLCCTVDVHHS